MTNPGNFTILKVIYRKGDMIMADLRSSWKNTGKGLGHAFRDLGKTLVRTAATGVKKVDNWANPEEEKETQNVEAETEKAEESEQ